MDDFKKSASLTISEAALKSLPKADFTKSDPLLEGSLGIKLPEYERDKVVAGVLHIGPSNFFRGHQAVYFDDMLAQGHTNYGVSVVSLRGSKRTAKLIDDLAAQDNLYTVVERDVNGVQPRVIGSIVEVIDGVNNKDKAHKKFTDPQTELVTMTVTQNGYYNDKNTGTIDLEHPEIIKCMDPELDFQTTIGFIARGLKARHDADMSPLPIMSCDNLPGNGTVLRNVVLGYIKSSPEFDGTDDFYNWVKNSVSFPETMVDRIVPAPEEKDIVDFNTGAIFNDNAPIFTESFRQWVIKYTGADIITNLHEADADITPLVSEYELTKIRILNGSHLAMGLIGRQKGYETTIEAMGDPDVVNFLDKYIDSMIDTRVLDHVAKRKDHLSSEKMDESIKNYRQGLEDYKHQTLNRLANPHMADELYRIARNASQKVPSRFLDTARELSAHGESYEEIAFGLASWMHYLELKKNDEQDTDINDSEAIRLGLPGLMENCSSETADFAVDALFEIDEIFARDMQEHEELKGKVAVYYDHIGKHGMEAALSDFVSGNIDTDLSNNGPGQNRQRRPQP